MPGAENSQNKKWKKYKFDFIFVTDVEETGWRTKGGKNPNINYYLQLNRGEQGQSGLKRGHGLG